MDVLTEDDVLEEIARRRTYTEDRWQDLRISASSNLPRLQRQGASYINQQACIYVTGSMARGEAGSHSDLDLFIVDDLDSNQPGRSQVKPRLTVIESAHLISTLDVIRHDANFRPFSRGGHFVVPISAQSMIKNIGAGEDDVENTFTARMLLLLNSRPLLNEPAYEALVKRALDGYWVKADPRAEYFPIMLTNEIRRWWGLLGLNFERYNPKISIDNFQVYSDSKRRVANLKLRYARLMAAYSSLLLLVFESGDKGISRVKAEKILRRSPIDRLEALSKQPTLSESIRSDIVLLLKQYSRYLVFMDLSESELQQALAEPDVYRREKDRSYDFHRLFSKIFSEVGQGKALYEYCIV